MKHYAKFKTYPNGATLIYRKHNLKHTTVVAGFLFGKNRDKYPEPTAHFVEHMFFKETENLSNEQLKRQMQEIFSFKNAATWIFMEAMIFTRANRALEPCFKLGSEMLLNTKFSKQYVEAEKGVIKQELLRKLASPDFLFGFTCRRNLRSTYNLDTQVLGSEKEIDSMTPKILKQFRDENFISENFIITIEGGISFAKAKRLAEKYYIHNLHSNPNYPVDKTTEASLPIDKPANLLIEKITSKKTKGTVYIKLDNNLFTLATQTQLSMLCDISSGIGGKLFSILRDDGLVYSTQMYYEKGQNHLALAIDFACSADNVNKIIFNIGKLFEEYRTQPFDESLLSKKKENALIRKDESVDDIYTNRLFTAYTFNGKETLTKRYIKERKKLFQNITPDDMHNLCKNIFSKPENIYVALQTDAKPDSFYTYEQMQKLLTKKPRQMKIKSKGSKNAKVEKTETTPKATVKAKSKNKTKSIK